MQGYGMILESIPAISRIKSFLLHPLELIILHMALKRHVKDSIWSGVYLLILSRVIMPAFPIGKPKSPECLDWLKDFQRLEFPNHIRLKIY